MNPNPNKVWVLVQDITWMHGKVFLFLIKIDQIFIHIPLKHFFSPSNLTVRCPQREHDPETSWKINLQQGMSK